MQQIESPEENKNLIEGKWSFVRMHDKKSIEQN